MRFRPSLDGHYKAQWPGNARFEEVKRRVRNGEDLWDERNRLEGALQCHVRERYADLERRTRALLVNPTWRRLILFAKWSHLFRRCHANQACALLRS